MKARLIALYLPQFHPIIENDRWQGKGYTEWTSVTRAKPLFRGHYQPRYPSELGFYDLRVPETRDAQAELAKAHGIFGFCYWHYWFGNGRRLLNRPFDEVLTSSEPDFPFCLAWANHSWTDKWFGNPNPRVIVKQEYPGVRDHAAHFYHILKAFLDPRYITIEGKPIFMVFRPRDLRNARGFGDLWRKLAHHVGLSGIYLIGHGLSATEASALGFDAINYSNHYLVVRKYPRSNFRRFLRSSYRELRSRPLVYTYEQASRYFLEDRPVSLNEYPSIITGWDNTPRWNRQGLVLTDSTPELFRRHLRDAIGRVSHKPKENRILFIKSWNEWAEGNYLEPDQRFGRAFLEATRDEIL